jgi:acyl-coenzyme A synthetase/AMP-(fatty) acid ligase
MYADQVEAIFNIHPEVARSALVGIGKPGSQTPVLCVEPLSKPNRKRRERIRNDLRQIGRNNTLGALIRNPQAHVPTFTDN